MLWFEDYIPATSDIIAIFTISAAMGITIISTLEGQVISYKPMFLIYMTMALVVAFAILFISAWILIHSTNTVHKQRMEVNGSVKYKSIN